MNTRWKKTLSRIFHQPVKRERKGTVLSAEPLENRILLNADQPMNALAEMNGTFESRYNPPTAVLKVDSQNFEFGRDTILLSFHVEADGESDFDADVPRVFDSSGLEIAPRFANNNLGSSIDSFSTFELPAGTYDLQVMGENGWTGDFQLTSSLVGDLNGDQIVDWNDVRAFRDVYRQEYLLEADADRDGELRIYDILQLAHNYRSSATFEPFANTAPALRDDEFNIVGLREFSGGSVFSNDENTDFLDSLTLNYDRMSTKGALAVIGQDGNVVYYPQLSDDLARSNVGESITDSITYTVTDLSGHTATATVSFHYEPTLARDDFYVTDEDNAIEIDAAEGLLGNDGDLNDAASLEVIDAPLSSHHGARLQVNQDGSFRYDPTSVALFNQLFVGETMSDSFTYEVQDNLGNSAFGVAHITITGRTDGGEDHYAADEDEPLVVESPGLLANDGVGATAITGQFETDQGAVVQINADGSFFYVGVLSENLRTTPAGGAAIDYFEYEYVDGASNTHRARVTIDVTGQNDDPVATDDFFETHADEPVVFDLLLNDFDFDLDDEISLLSVEESSDAGSSLWINDDGRLEYDPTTSDEFPFLPLGHNQTDTFSYTIVDRAGKTATAEATVLVTGLNHDPEIVQEPSFFANENEVLDVSAINGLLTFVDDIDNEVLTMEGFTVTTELGANVIAQSDGSFVYDSANSLDLQFLRLGEQLIDSFTYSVADSHGGSVVATAEIIVTGQQDDPDDVYKALSSEVFSVAAPGLLENDEGNDIELIGYQSDTDLGGQVVALDDGSFEYDPTGIDPETLEDALAESPIAGFVIDRFVYSYAEKDDIDLEFVATATILLADTELGLEQPIVLPASAYATSLRTGAFSDTDLAASGDMKATVSGDRSTVSIFGPTGYGFTLTGAPNTWNVTSTNCNPTGCQGRDFVATSTVNLSTGLGISIPIPANSVAQLGISTQATGSFNGNVTSFDLRPFGFSTRSGGLVSMKDTFGIDLSAIGLGSGSQGQQWGLALGSVLKSRLNPAPPVQNAVPYFFYQSTIGNGVLTVGDSSISSSAAGDFTIVFDPTDPMLFVKGSGGGFSAGLGGSKNGRIPVGISEGDVSEGHRNHVRPNPNNGNAREYWFNSHLYVEGTVTLGRYPVSIEGALGIDMDVNNDGRLAGNIGRDLDDLFRGQKSIADVLSNFNDIEIAAKGKVNYEVEIPGTNAFGLTIPMATGSAIWGHNTVSARGNSSQPFANTPLSFYEIPSTTIDAYIRTNGDFQIKADIGAAKLAGLELTGASGHLLINKDVVSIGGRVTTPIFDVNLAGTYYTTGYSLSNDIEILGIKIQKGSQLVAPNTLILQGSAGKTLDFGPFNAYYEGRFQLLVHSSRFEFDLWVGAGLSILGCGVSLSGSASIAVANGGLNVAGSGAVEGGCIGLTFRTGFSFDNHGFSIDLPSPAPDIHVRF